MSDITCFCGSRTTVFKRILTGCINRIWILSNYYRHIINHIEKQDKNTIKKSAQQNTVKNYFTLANKDSTRDTINKRNIEIESTTLEVIFFFNKK